MTVNITRMLRLVALAAMVLMAVPVSSDAQMTTDANVQRALESQGYKDVKDIKFTAEGVTAKAVKDGKEVSVVVDPTGKIMQRKP